MQRSSPLAAMQPMALPFGTWGCRAQAHPSYNSGYRDEFPSKLSFDTSGFNFKDLSMNNAPMDYFSLRPVRGSSPTASLAADLSSNFHIDQSPQLPTPRRSLFPSDLLRPLGSREAMTTPPPPSSSPGIMYDSMDISPLPHKHPYVDETQVEPTPLELPSEDMTRVAEEASETLFEPFRRRRFSIPRPSLTRTKGYTTSTVSLKSNRIECPPFKFGSGVALKSPLSTAPQADFRESPQRDGRPQSADSPCAPSMGPPPRHRQSSSNLRAMGSSVASHVRKSSNPMQRPRKQFRRSLSMFEHPAEIIIKPEENHFVGSKLDPVMDIDDPPRLQLPHFCANDESLPRITKETMIDVLDGRYMEAFAQSLIVDCRFEYEFEGGHIDGAINYNDKEQLADRLFDSMPCGPTLLIFHCEYSACRAPLMAKHVRGRDRACNAHRYPNLTYPEVYILDGGYSSFFANHKPRCSPQNYVEMGDKQHENACERGMGRVKQQRTKLSRAQTYAFGQHEQLGDDSPTISNRQYDSLVDGMDIESPIDSRRQHARRLVSF